MDLHDFEDVAVNYDRFCASLAGQNDTAAVRFHLDLARQYGGRGVLDIACGTGLTLIPLIEQSYDVIGVDISQAMLDVLARKLEGLSPDVRRRASLIRSNMTTFEVGRPSSLAFIARSGFLHLLTPQEQERALRNIHRHLEPGGVLSFNSFDPNYEQIAGNLKGTNPAPSLRAEYVNSQGRKERIWNTTEFDPAEQRIEATWTFEELGDDGEVVSRRERPLRMRWSFEPELRHLLRLCGFEVMDLYSSYDKEPRRYGTTLIWVARRT